MSLFDISSYLRSSSHFQTYTSMLPCYYYATQQDLVLKGRLRSFRQFGYNPTSLDRVQFIAEKIKAYSPTVRVDDGSDRWVALRDQKNQLVEFGSLAFRDTRKVLFTPLQLLTTIDDDIFGSRAADSQVKAMSNRKADKEGHVADAVADALFPVFFCAEVYETWRSTRGVCAEVTFFAFVWSV